MMKNSKSIYFPVAFFLLCLSFNAHAFSLDTNMQDPSITTNNPWLEASIDGDGNLKMEATGIVSNDYVSQWYFNFNDNYSDSSKFSISHQGGTIEATGYSFGLDSFKADGVGGYFDLRFDFSNSGDTFTDGESSEYKIYYDGTLLTLNDFNFVSVNGDYSFHSAAKIQGGNNPNWVSTSAVPIPSAVWLLSTGLIGLVIIKRRKMR